MPASSWTWSLDNILGALGLLAQNMPLFGLGDDVLGGALYIGIGAKGDLANIIDCDHRQHPADHLRHPAAWTCRRTSTVAASSP